jgi:DNA repair exonuclease SbcCD ATPase subunit
MQLERIRALNFCQLLDRDDTFSDGLNAIIGRNGSGKSNLLNAIRYTLTGINGNPGKLEDNVAQLGRADEKSLVEATLVHGNVRMKITRQLRPSGTKAKLEVTERQSGARIESISGDTKVVARIEEYLGVTADIINEMVLVAQDDIFGFLDMTPAKRLASFQKLFRTEVSADIYAALNKKLNTFPVYVPATTPEACEAEIVRYQELVTAWERHASGLRPLPIVQQERDQAVQIVGNYNAYVALRDQVAKDQTSLTQLSQQLTAECDRLATLDLQHAEIKGRHAAAAASVADARAALANLANWRRVEQSRVTITESLASTRAARVAMLAPVPSPLYTPKAMRDSQVLVANNELQCVQRDMHYDTVENLANGVRTVQQQLQALVLPTQPADYLDGQARHTHVSQAMQAVNGSLDLLKTADAGHATCPTCAAPIAPEVVARTRQELPALQQALAAANRRADDSTRYDNALRTYETQRQSLETGLAQWQAWFRASERLPAAVAAREAALATQQRDDAYDAAIAAHRAEIDRLDQATSYWQQQLDALPALQETNCDETSLQLLVHEHESRESLLAQLEPPLRQARAEAAKLQGQYEQLGAALRTRQGQLHTAISVSEAEKVQAEQRQALLDQELAAINDASHNLGLARNSLTSWQQQLLRVQQTIAASQVVKVKAEYCTRLAELFRDLPKLVAHRNLQRLQATINGVLESFRTDFRVSPDAELTFTAMFTDGRRQPADRLSGGQKVVLALAFRLAVNLLFAENVGMLVLDEPTAWLDQQNIRGFEPVLSRLKAFSASRGLQIIMVTHESNLAPLFDRTIQL